MIHPIPFYTLALLAVASALGVILARRPVYAVLNLVVTLFSLSALFLFLHAYFLAIIQILVYAGAILVLFLFVVMLLDMAPEGASQVRGMAFRLTATVFGGLFLLQLAAIARAFWVQPAPGTAAPAEGTTAAVGRILFTTYALPFEVASLLLLVGIIGAVVLAQKSGDTILNSWRREKK